ncbi:MAG: carboxypeptidase regulatory-like domain-containing protein [Hyphomicrobiales bacterium]|nr:carboxypeptidase regulatory-like domain-containing protein [Hyphomicrobiales bacterium]MDE2114164.1 carboxypeptidase regulatory-like domain-containing protein [Hyphomicrobiales bacterium]
MRKVLIYITFSLFLAGCQTSENIVPIDASFNPAEAQFINRNGDGEIRGQVFLSGESGHVHKGAGEIVRLIPASSYARQRFSRLYGGSKYVAIGDYPKATQTDPNYIKYIRLTKTDASGRFRFDHVAPGNYYISSQVLWKKSGDARPQGGAMYDTVKITGQEDGPVPVVVSGT